ncbi:hypothetical protein ACFSGX_03855 [Sphingomonas arantia]|uniref:DUF3945 domain-containing protein n=1 Tax=Sphingomonas arantia TaxID=1460676 RepID=A0ABW4TTR9_9SPHN
MAANEKNLKFRTLGNRTEISVSKAKRFPKKFGSGAEEGVLVGNLSGDLVRFVTAPTLKGQSPKSAIFHWRAKGKKGKKGNYVEFTSLTKGPVLEVDTGTLQANEPELSRIEERLTVGERVKKLGVEPGKRLSADEALTAKRGIVMYSLDLFSSEREAEVFLQAKNFDGTGVTGEQLIQDGRTGRVISRLDELRFGFQG